MPIPINLLAEAQAAEEMRRRDPVKRAIWIGGFLVVLVGLWIAKLQLDIVFENIDIGNLEARWKKIEAEYKEVVDARTKTAEIEAKLAALDRLSTNRFLWGNVFNALQQTTVEHVQITRIKTDQRFENIEAKTSSNKTVTQPATVVENIGLTIEARDWNVAGETYKKFQETLSNCDYFLKHLQRRDGFVFNTLSAPMVPDTANRSRQFVLFTLEARFPEVRRNE